ncbi:magnesium dechelatase SGRL, chloroplastic isoform X2 [Cucumis melo]|uniref:Magnesium dechelatase SGRL, chloroplastic isoform X2 n=1 Tax=Cucumis melo TaxID=3656 RepID=A0ABM3KL37_CUCME|nr:magnesium dechelatase SGRL, chloroplastic isoform X2 [Cucumis melo]
MAFHCVRYSFSPLPGKPNFKLVQRNNPALLFSSFSTTRASYNTLVSEAVRILVPPARFEASKLKVVFSREVTKSAGIIPRTYILSHCDFTANLTLTISDVINLDQDDVVAEWKKVKDEMYLHVHCYVSGPSSLLDVAAEFRYHIFSKELPLVLESVLYGDSILFGENPELLDSLVRVYFHSSSPKYNRLECWGPLKDAVLGRHHHIQGLLNGSKDVSSTKKLRSPKSIFQALFAFLL